MREKPSCKKKTRINPDTPGKSGLCAYPLFAFSVKCEIFPGKKPMKNTHVYPRQAERCPRPQNKTQADTISNAPVLLFFLVRMSWQGGPFLASGTKKLEGSGSQPTITSSCPEVGGYKGGGGGDGQNDGYMWSQLEGYRSGGKFVRGLEPSEDQ